MSSKQTDLKQTDLKQTDVKQADAKQADAKQADAKQADAKQADAKQADAKQADAKPVTRIVVMGDSMARSLAKLSDDCFMVTDSLVCDGATSERFLTELAIANIDVRAVDVVVIAIGNNDFGHGLAAKETAANMAAAARLLACDRVLLALPCVFGTADLHREDNWHLELDDQLEALVALDAHMRVIDPFGEITLGRIDASSHDHLDASMTAEVCRALAQSLASLV
jgi:hypothetical protein